jgi:hypothetical protein
MWINPLFFLFTEEEASELDEDDNEHDDDDVVNYMETDGLASTSSDSDEEFVDYETKKDRKVKFSRGKIKVRYKVYLFLLGVC